MEYLRIFSLAIILWIADFTPARSEMLAMHPSVGVIVEYEKQLKLSSEQARALQSLRLEMEKEALKKTAELKVGEIELSELTRGDAVDLGKIEAKLAQIDSIRTGLILSEIRAAEQAKSVLTAEQRKKLKSLSVPPPSSQGNLLESNLFKQIQAAFKEQFKDQKIVDIETTQAVVSRLLDWTKFLGFFVGIPLALLGLVLGFLGMKTYTDFSRLVTTAQKEVKKNLESAEKAA
jgi:hypothetical protein